MCVCVCVCAAYEQAVEEQQLRLEMAQLKRENDQYMKNYERSKQVSAIVDRKMKRGEELKQVSHSLSSLSLSLCV